MESRNVHTHYSYVKPLNEGFIIPLILFSSPLVSNFLKSCMVLSYPSHKMCMKEENNREETLKVFLITRTKFLWALKFTAE